MHACKPWGRKKWMLGGLAAVLIAAACFALPYLRTPLPGEEAWVFGLFFTLGAANALFGFALLIGSLLTPQKTYILHQRGLFITDGVLQISLPWREIVHLHTRFEGDPKLVHFGVGEYVDTIETADKELYEVRESDVENAYPLICAVGQALARERSPSMAERIRGGESISFGPIVLCAERIAVGADSVSYRDLRAIVGRPRSRKILLELEKHGGESSLRTNHRVDEIPDWEVMAAVVWELKRGLPPQSSL